MQIIRKYNEEEIKALIASSIEGVSPQKTNKVKEVNFKVNPNYDCYDREIAGYTVNCEVEIEELPG